MQDLHMRGKRKKWLGLAQQEDRPAGRRPALRSAWPGLPAGGRPAGLLWLELAWLAGRPGSARVREAGSGVFLIFIYFF